MFKPTAPVNGQHALTRIANSLVVADDGFVDYSGPLDDSEEIQGGYDGFTWCPQWAPGISKYSDTQTNQYLAKTSQPITRANVTGKLVEIEAFGDRNYALRVKLNSESHDILLPQLSGLYNRLNKVSDDAVVVIRCDGWHEGGKALSFRVWEMTPKSKILREKIILISDEDKDSSPKKNDRKLPEIPRDAKGDDLF